MAILQWSDEHSIGVPVFDDEHKQLIDLINCLNAIEGNILSTSNLAGLLDETMEYAERHTSHEETIMKEHNYPDTEAHTSEHTLMKETVTDYRSRPETDSPKVAKEMYDFLRAWLLDHLMQCDKDFGKWIVENDIPIT